MPFKPFKSPLLQINPNTSSADQEPALKKQKFEHQNAIGARPLPLDTERVKSPKNLKAFPAVKVVNSSEDSDARSYSVLWRKVTGKKHKTWDGDGILDVKAGYASLKDDRGKEIGRTACSAPLLPGSTLSISGKDVEIDSLLSCARQPSSLSVPAVKAEPSVQESAYSVSAKNARSNTLASYTRPTTKPYKPIASTNIQPPKENSHTPAARHDPSATGALVMKRPSKTTKDGHIVDVVVDPLLSARLREHQRAGVAFLYECVMGLRAFNGEGAILADEMGLGKTLQTITLIWTLLKQNPFHGVGPIVKKVIVVCPKSVQMNWRKEFYKWLGKERVGVMVANDRSRIHSFTKGRSYQVMIIGYELLRDVQDDLHNAPIDLVVLDEGHRLKSAKNKAAQAIKSLSTERRIVLSGTPIQNDLSELYHIVDVVNPGLLGKYSRFKRDIEQPIIRGSQQEATEEERTIGRECRRHLDSMTSEYMLRRTADIIAKYLPPKTEYVVFCRPTDAQVAVYAAMLDPMSGSRDASESIYGAALNNSHMSLKLINVLKKVCNSPSLLVKEPGEAEEGTIARQLSERLPTVQLRAAVASSKLSVLDELLHRISSTTEEKVVVVSNYTSTLDLIGSLLTSLDYTHSRLDGNTPPSKRQELVDTFNRAPAKKCFVFLLSTKAGGMGINLIGASRLILFDIDWNPSPDQQAMARICRDGQKRPCYIYRLITKGAIDEKIFQRQMMKMGLADSVVDGKKSTTSAFSKEELRDIFTLDRRETCQTHDLLGCACAQDGAPIDDGQVDDVEQDEDLPEAEALTKPARQDWVRASQVSVPDDATVAAEREKQNKHKMSVLLQYTHTDTMSARKQAGEKPLDVDADTRVADGVDDVQDDVRDDVDDYGIRDSILRSIALDPTSRVDHVFAKMSKGQIAEDASVDATVSSV